MTWFIVAIMIHPFSPPSLVLCAKNVLDNLAESIEPVIFGLVVCAGDAAGSVVFAQINGCTLSAAVTPAPAAVLRDGVSADRQLINGFAVVANNGDLGILFTMNAKKVPGGFL